LIVRRGGTRGDVAERHSLPWFKSNTVIQRRGVAVPNSNLGKIHMITFTLELISPDVAKQYLERNKNNRSITKERVLGLTRDIQSGAFVVTHQCIAFNANGELIDGQHRLSAVVASKMTVQMYVARYERTETAMALPFDNGLTRKHYDILDITRKQSELASAVLRIKGGPKTFTPADVQACIDTHKDRFNAILACSHNTAKHRSSAGAKAAIALLLRKYPDAADEIVDQYVKFLNFNLDGMWPSAAACVRALENIRATGGSGVQRMVSVRVWYAFHPENKQLKLIRILDESAIVAEMQAFC
jgi:hypothetical protein